MEFKMTDTCTAIKWSSVYSLGDKRVDIEHQKLFDLANKIELCKENEQELQKALKELIQYTKYHFKSEEKYMREFHYAHLQEHIRIHEKIVENLNTIIKEMHNVPLESTYLLIRDFIKNGLVGHIIIEDKKVQHFKKNRLGLRALFAWKDDYKLLQEDIDTEHKKLFQIAIRALQYRDDSDLKSHIKKIIIELNEYMKFHFEHEEEFMESIGYPQIQEHKLLHENIITQINDLIRNIASYSLVEFEKKLMTYIDIWLVNHIVFEDKKVMCYHQALKKTS
jgi:hemerythrin